MKSLNKKPSLKFSRTSLKEIPSNLEKKQELKGGDNSNEFKAQVLNKNNKKEVEMGLLGSCRGILGLRKSLNWIFILDVLFLIIGGGYLFTREDFTLALGVVGIFLVVLVFLMANSRIRGN